ncbi:MAG: response regulator transcription factor [Endomicrobium sp.]|nr:response regulator transcription factor [Endomicrobium sp.]
MIKNRVVIVDDEEHIRSLLKDLLESNGFTAILCKDTDDGYKKILKSRPSLVVLDVNMPAVGGIELCKMLRGTPEVKNIPIIMLTVESTEVSKVVGFESGADDYITKPFSNMELVARIESLLRRARYKNKRVKIECDGLEMFLSSRTVLINKKEVLLRPKEFDLLYMLLSNPNVVVNKEVILENVFEYNAATSSRTVDTHIKNLRCALGQWGKHIKTVFGIGVKFVTCSKS